MLAAVAVIAASYLIGSIPVAYFVGRATGGMDIRDVGSGNIGASNIWQSVSKSLVVPVGLAQIAQGVTPVLIAKAAGQSESVQAASAIAALLANNWNPWLRLAGGRGIGLSIGALLMLAPWALAAFIIVALAGVALRAIPQFVIIALAVTPIVAAVTGASGAIVAACAAFAGIAIIKRVLANALPTPGDDLAGVLLNRLAYDRDTRDRDTWVTRNLEQDRTARR